MTYLKHVWLLVVLLTLAACGRMGAPAPEVTPDDELAPLDVVTANDVVTPGNTSKVPGQAGSARFYLQVEGQGNDGFGGCNVSTDKPGTITVTSSNTALIPNPGSLQLTVCNDGNAKEIAYQVASGIPSTNLPATVTLTGTASGGDGGSYKPGSFTVTIVAPVPTDSSPPVITASVDPASPDGSNGWYKGNATVSWNVLDGESAISSMSGCDTTTIDADTSGTTLTCTATSAGGTSSKSVSIKRDATAPTVTPADVNNTTWHNSALSEDFTASDATSGLADTTDASFTLTASAQSADANTPTVVSKTVTDQAGNSTTRSISAKIDKTKPTITASAQTADGKAYTSGTWTNQNVTVSFACSDALSGIVQDTCPAPVTVSSDTAANGQTIFDNVSDRANNMETSNAVVVKVDKTAPTITYDGRTPPANADSWNNSDVTVNWSCSDTLSGAVAATASQTVSTEGKDQSTTGSCTDNAGNRAQDIQSGINIDTTAPDVSVTNVSNTTYTLGSVPTAGCSTSDTLSGVKTSASPSTNGGTVGSVTITCSGAEDKAGNTNSASVSYNVIYNFTGFFQPVDMNGIFNVVKAGSAVPVKFKLGGNQGLDIFATGYPKVSSVSCPTSAALDSIEETSTATTSGLKYDTTADQYNYTWKTGSWAGTCRRLDVKLVDGQTYSALFKFNK